jgi:peptidoglycan/LPS O-acetylase OafA/YrhL
MNHRRNVFVASVIALVLSLAPMALAAKGSGKGNTPTAQAISLSAGPYTFGGSVHVTTNVSTDLSPWIMMSCSQNGAVVATSNHAAFPGGSYYDAPFNLGPTLSWSGGAADCTFTVAHFSSSKLVTDATASLHVDA